MGKKTFPAKFLLVTALWLPLSNFHFEASGDASGDVIPSPTCVNCSKCEYPCQQSSPPLLGYPSYGAPPPPPPSPPPSGYSIYGTPPPPQEKDHSECPPAAGVVQCCTSPPPYAPPNPYTYVPNNEGQSSASTILPVLVPLFMLFSSFVFLFLLN